MRTGSITETRRGFRRERNQQEDPAANAIRRWLRQWREEGSVTCKKPPGRPSVRTPDNIARVLASVSRSPRRSARTQSRRNVTQRWSVNFCPRIFHQTVVPCGFNKMVVRPTRLWLRRLFPQPVISRFGDVPWPLRSPDLTSPDFFLWAYLKSKVYSPYRLTCTQRKRKGRNGQKFRRNTSSRYAQLLNWCAPKRHCTTKVKLWKKKKILSTIVNCDVLKLVSITFSKMLFLFIISSPFLPHLY
jgi:hypothetical protein